MFQSREGIHRMNADGSGLVTLSTFGGVPSWSPDGLKIAFHSADGIWVMNEDGTQPQQLTNHGRWAAWSPYMTEIAFSSDLEGPDYDLWLMNVDGTNARRVLARPGSDIDVVWSPSERILFAAFVDRRSSYEVFAFEPLTSALTRLTASIAQDFEPASSPDGARIAFASFRKPSGIYVINADGSSPQLVISGGRQPSWAP